MKERMKGFLWVLSIMVVALAAIALLGGENIGLFSDLFVAVIVVGGIIVFGITYYVLFHEKYKAWRNPRKRTKRKRRR